MIIMLIFIVKMRTKNTYKRERKMKTYYSKTLGRKVTVPERDALVSDSHELIKHILTMADDAYLVGHPEWNEIVKEANNLYQYINK